MEAREEPTAISWFASLIARARDGDDQAQNHLIEEYGPEILRVVRRFLAHEARRLIDSMDIVQSVWREFFTHELPDRDWDDDRKLRAFLRRLAWAKVIAVNRRHLDSKGRDLHRVRSLQELSPQEWEKLKDPHPSAAAVIEDEELLGMLLAQLPPNRACIVPLLCAGYTHYEISEIVGCTERTVGRTVEYLRQLVRDKGTRGSC